MCTKCWAGVLIEAHDYTPFNPMIADTVRGCVKGKRWKQPIVVQGSAMLTGETAPKPTQAVCACICRDDDPNVSWQRCSDCGDLHKMIVTTLSRDRARWCKDCNCYHTVRLLFRLASCRPCAASHMSPCLHCGAHVLPQLHLLTQIPNNQVCI